VILDILPAIGSKPSIEYIKALLTEKKLPVSDRVAQFFSTAALITKPDITIVNTIKVSVCYSLTKSTAPILYLSNLHGLRPFTQCQL
jgi:hypothetical protein